MTIPREDFSLFLLMTATAGSESQAPWGSIPYEPEGSWISPVPELLRRFSEFLGQNCRLNVIGYTGEEVVFPQLITGWTIMSDRKNEQESRLIRECLSGSEQAWTEFYRKYVCLVRSVIRRKLRVTPIEVEDVVQKVFEDLVPALKTFDRAYSLTRFICMITERVCIDEFHRKKAAKRDAETTSIDHHDGGDEGSIMVRSGGDSPEELVAQEELRQILRQGLWMLSDDCWKLLTLRELEELSYKEISKILNEKQNTLTVRARRCREELRGICHEIVRKGCSK
ncbi:RNA polymerase sigma factor [Thermodesulfobacteriota bacterium]